MRTVFASLWLTALFFWGGSVSVSAQTSMSEYHVKALFLLNFVNYVDWPNEPASGTPGPFVIGILGQDNFDDNLTSAIEGKSINGRKIVLTHLSDDQDPSGCSILFISSSEDSRLSGVLGQTRELPILTVGETALFFQKGGIINFKLIDDKIHLQINLSVAQRARLKISSKLLGVADVVQD